MLKKAILGFAMLAAVSMAASSANAASPSTHILKAYGKVVDRCAAEYEKWVKIACDKAVAKINATTNQSTKDAICTAATNAVNQSAAVKSGIINAIDTYVSYLLDATNASATTVASWDAKVTAALNKIEAARAAAETKIEAACTPAT